MHPLPNALPRIASVSPPVSPRVPLPNSVSAECRIYQSSPLPQDVCVSPSASPRLALPNFVSTDVRRYRIRTPAKFVSTEGRLCLTVCVASLPNFVSTEFALRQSSSLPRADCVAPFVSPPVPLPNFVSTEFRLYRFLSLPKFVSTASRLWQRPHW
jgi:hypothetical protein